MIKGRFLIKWRGLLKNFVVSEKLFIMTFSNLVLLAFTKTTFIVVWSHGWKKIKLASENGSIDPSILTDNLASKKPSTGLDALRIVCFNLI